MRLIDADELLSDLIFPTEQFKRGFTETINDAPTIEAEPTKHGRWKKVVHSNNNITHYCSECKSVFYKGCADQGEYNYCPNCGARMDEVEE